MDVVYYNRIALFRTDLLRVKTISKIRNLLFADFVLFSTDFVAYYISGFESYRVLYNFVSSYKSPVPNNIALPLPLLLYWTTDDITGLMI